MLQFSRLKMRTHFLKYLLKSTNMAKSLTTKKRNLPLIHSHTHIPMYIHKACSPLAYTQRRQHTKCFTPLSNDLPAPDPNYFPTVLFSTLLSFTFLSFLSLVSPQSKWSGGKKVVRAGHQTEGGDSICCIDGPTYAVQWH